MKEQENKGITLIALVITIIVLLILAGVSIAMLTGDNGILTQANKSKEETTLSEQEEKRKLKEQEAYMEEYNFVDTELTEAEATAARWKKDSTYIEYEGDESIVYIPSKIGDDKTALFNIKNNENITKVVVSGDIKDLSNCKFIDLPNLETVVFKKGITKLGQIMFCNCEKLEYLALPSTLTEIDGFAFEASSIKNIVIPKSVTTVGAGIFGWCKNPITIHCEAEESPEKENMPAGEQYNWSEDWLNYATEGITVDWGYKK